MQSATYHIGQPDNAKHCPTPKNIEVNKDKLLEWRTSL